MLRENIETLDIYLYVTHDVGYIDCPLKTEGDLLETFSDIYGQKPRWNRT